MERSLQAGSSPRVTTRFEYAEIPSLRQLLAPVLANGHHLHSADPLSTMVNGSGAEDGMRYHHGQSMFQFGMTQRHLQQQQHQQHQLQSSTTSEASEDDPEMPPLQPSTSEEDEESTEMPPPLESSSSSTTTGRPVRSAALAARAAMTAANPPAATDSSTAAVKPDELISTPRKRRAKRRGSESPKSSPTKRARTSLKPPPNAKKDPDTPAELASCAICMCEPDREDVSNIDGCQHLFCFSCIGKWSDTENSCPLCKSRFSKIARVHPQRKKKGGPSVHNVKRVKHQDQRSDVVSGAALENLLASIANNGTLPGASVAGSRLGYIFARMGNGFGGGGPGMHGVRTSRVTTTFSGFSLEDNLFDSDDEDEESYVAVPNFMNVIMRSTLASAMASRHRGGGQGNNNNNSMASAMNQHPNHPVNGGMGMRINLNQAMGMNAGAQAASSPPARSHATNAAQVGAGSAAENPLEIGDDSEDENNNANNNNADDDDDDDVVEVVQVSRRA